MNSIILILVCLIGLLSGLLVAIFTFPKREINRLYKEFRLKEGLDDGQFKHFSEMVDHNLRVIVKPNCETLYSSTFLKKPKGVYTLRIPQTERYFSVAFLNERTDVLGYITNNDLNKGEDSLFQLSFGENGMNSHIQLSAKTCWIILRFGLDSKKDYDEVRSIQGQVELLKHHDD